MSTLAVESKVPCAVNVVVSSNAIKVDLSDGDTLNVPLEWFPRLHYATMEERNNWRLIGMGHGIHWEDIDEDISVEGLMAGKPSYESRKSFNKWLNQRQSTIAVT